MTAADWDHVTVLFSQALEREGSSREAFLADSCGELRSEVERLLRAHERSSGFLETPLIFTHPLTESLWTGQVLKQRYRIERFLARGGSSEVYMAQDLDLAGKPVIVKFLHSWARQDPAARERFRREMEALARIGHRGVVAVLDVGETADRLPFLVIEYVDGATLRSEMRGGPMAVERVSQIVRQVGEAVAAAHEKRVLHRDLKPENIMLEQPGTDGETVRLIDFGIARVDEPNLETVSRLTLFAGTTPYMAPEHLAGRPRAASDVYAIGVIAFELLLGRRPFLAASPVELYEQQRAGVRCAMRRERPEIPEAAERAVRQMLSFRSDQRGSPGQLADALLQPSNGVWPRRRFLAACGAGAAGIGGGWWWPRARPLAPSDRAIVLPPGAEPLEHGFKRDRDIEMHIVPNAGMDGYEAIRLITVDQGNYWHGLSAAQQGATVRGGWKMTVEAAIEEGALWAHLDCDGMARRYPLNLVRKDGRDVAWLVTAIVPALEGMEYPIEAPPGARHTLMLMHAPGLETAELWVDGVRRLAGYGGLTDYRYHRGFEIGVGRYQSTRGAGVVWGARLEIG